MAGQAAGEILEAELYTIPRAQAQVLLRTGKACSLPTASQSDGSHYFKTQPQP